MRAIKNSFNIDDTYTKLYRRPQLKASEQTHVKDNVFLQPDYNYQADVLHLPTDSFGFCKLLVVVDLANNKMEMEKMKDSESSEETLRAFNRMLKCGIMKIPKASLTTDGGSGFKGVFHKFLYDNGVDHKVARVGRHHQLANVDNACRQLGEIFHGIMNAREEKTGKKSTRWVYMIDTVREKLNDFRTKRTPKDITTYQYPIFDAVEPKKEEKIKKGKEPTFKLIKPKYKIGDMVNVLLQEPVNTFDKKHVDKRFRMRDYRLSKRKYRVSAVLYYAGTPPYRYLIEGLPGASFIEQELKQV